MKTLYVATLIFLNILVTPQALLAADEDASKFIEKWQDTPTPAGVSGGIKNTHPTKTITCRVEVWTHHSGATEDVKSTKNYDLKPNGSLTLFQFSGQDSAGVNIKSTVFK